jgi:hypothetical protein
LARTAPEHATEPERDVVAPLTPASTDLPPKSAAIEPAPSEEKAERRLQPEQLLAETNRTSVQPEEESADERVERPFEPVPLVDRASPTGQPAEPEQTPEEKAEESDTGDPLSPVLQERMERLLDVPLRDVRIFRNSVSRRATQSHQADAVTIGNDVHLAPDRGEPSAPSGQALLAHELSHVAARRADALLPEAEETHAQALEHAVARQPDLGRPSQPTPVALEHRAAPPRSSATADALAGPAAYTSVLPSPGGSAAGSASAGGAATIATAPTDRIVSGARTTAMAPDLLRNDDLMPPTEDEKPEERDEAGFVDRVVDAVLRRLKRDGALERERRGPFRSEIGG